ncbi:MAG: cbb3-type cytochrome c oxidase subunit 3 [Rhodospirillales bacterium]|nr:cbb3-type cytochrome c oxidase subunit 3 [Rhodospirillales bacterium]
MVKTFTFSTVATFAFIRFGEMGMGLQSLSETARTAWVIWLMVLFGGILFWAFRSKNKNRPQNDGKLPFADDQDRD